MEKVKTIVGKEWSEVFKNRLVLFTVAFLPLVFAALPIITLNATSGIEIGENIPVDDPPDEFFGAMCEELSEVECVQVFTLNLYTLLLMVIPVVIPGTIAAYSVVGEKTSNSLEPLLATPVTTLELLAGKAIAAVVPAVAATWLAFGVFVVGGRLMSSDVVFARIIQPVWLIAIFVVGPLLTLMGVNFALIISSRVSDPRVAEQLSSLIVLPIILLVVGQSIGFILIDQRTILIMGLVVIVVDAALMYFSVKLFQRETILTRWK